jgi:enoyl-CoA hydratase/carnithine racemase
MDMEARYQTSGWLTKFRGGRIVRCMLTTEIRGSTAWLLLDRPEKLNAMPRGFFAELSEAMATLAADDRVRVVVFSGAGRCFSVGGDIEDFANIGGVADRRAYMATALGAYRAVDELPKPTIAAVHGHAMGGGCELTMVCDVVVADATARFGTPEAGVGLVPGPGIVRGLSHANLHWMKYLVLTGLPIDAEQARLAGLVNTVVAEGEHLAEAQRLADVMATRSPLAQSVGKAFLNRGAWDDQGYAAEAIALLQGAEDFAEGIAAFAERRAPAF